MNRRLLPLAFLTVLFCAGTGASQDADTSFDELTDRPESPEPFLTLPEPALPEPTLPGEVTGRFPAGQPAAVAFAHSLPDAEFDPGSSGATGPTIHREPGADVATPVLPAPVPVPEPAAPQITAADIRADERWPAAARASNGVIANRQVIAFYGHPRSRYMGILGETPIEEMTAALLAQAAEYDELNGDIGVAPAFHIIYGTVFADGSVGVLNEERLMEYINYAADHDILVFLDHQIGNGTVADAITAMLPYLRYPNVHLAIDPEWATPIPGREIGHVTAADINNAQFLIYEYLERNHLPGDRMLVVHQFNWRMIADREDVRADYPRVELIHNADGFGQPAQKYVSWEFNVQATNLPLKGFKLFYPKSWRDGGYDEPLLTPAQVLQLDPVPVYVQYQ
jgi:hypothetical protein